MDTNRNSLSEEDRQRFQIEADLISLSINEEITSIPDVPFERSCRNVRWYYGSM